MRIKHELGGRALIEAFISLHGIIKGDDLGVDDIGNRQAVVQDGLHELTVIFQHRCLAGVEGLRLRPAKAEAQ